MRVGEVGCGLVRWGGIGEVGCGLVGCGTYILYPLHYPSSLMSFSRVEGIADPW